MEFHSDNIITSSKDNKQLKLVEQIKSRKVFRVFSDKEKNEAMSSFMNQSQNNVSVQEQLFSLKDFYEKEIEWLNNIVFQIIIPFDASNTEENSFKFVQIQRHEVNTYSQKNTILQIIDVSQKVLYDKVKGERKLTQIINATVSHEMRNPIHAIKVQVQEMKSLNQ